MSSALEFGVGRHETALSKDFANIFEIHLVLNRPPRTNFRPSVHPSAIFVRRGLVRTDRKPNLIKTRKNIILF